MIRLVLYSAIVLLATSCAWSSASGDPPVIAGPPSYDRLVREARSAAEKGQSERAATLAEQAVAQSPQQPDAYLVWGLALAQQGKPDASAAKYELARERGSRERRLFVELASSYDVAQRYDDAVRVYRAYLAGAPQDAEMRQELGLTLLILQRYDEAVTELDQVAKARPDDLQAQQDLGYALLRAGDAARAAPLFEAILARDPTRHEARRFLARARAAEGDAAAAISLLDLLIEQRPKDARALRMRARLYLIVGRVNDAAADYERLLGLTKPGDAAVLLGYAGVLIALNDLDRARRTLERVRREIGAHPLLDFRNAQIAWRRGQRSALKTLATFARNHPSDVEAWREVFAAARKYGDKKLKREAAAKLRWLGDLP